MNDPRIDKIEKSLSQIMTELVGNPEFGRIGIAGHLKQIQHTQEKQAQEIQKIKNRLFKDKVVIASAGATAGIMAGWLSKTMVGKWLVAASSMFK